MPGITLKIDDSEFQKTFGVITSNLTDKKTAFRQVAAVVRESIRYNFQVGGRPATWKASKRGERDKVPGKKGATLRNTNRLMNSITTGGRGAVTKVTANGVIVGTSVIYAGTMHYGAKKGSFGSKTFMVHAFLRQIGERQVKVRAHQRTVKLPWGDIPARPFAMVQEEDMIEINEILAHHIVQGTP